MGRGSGNQELLAVGLRVKTTAACTPDSEWTEAAQASRRWGVTGTIVAEHDSHGLCYDVLHDDGTTGHYDPLELAAE